jgi:hypothetical protein
MTRKAFRLLGWILALFALFALIAFFPAPIEGNWLSAIVVCMCDSHNFVRFEDGKVLWVSEAHAPPTWIGNYEKIGWGTYTMDGLFEGSPMTVYSGTLTLRPFSFFTPGLRDCAFAKCNRILNDPAQEWISDMVNWNIVVRNSGDEVKYFFADREIPATKIETFLTTIQHNFFSGNSPLLVYTEHETIPPELQQVLTNLGTAYETRPIEQLRLARHRRRGIGWTAPQSQVPPTSNPCTRKTNG